MAFRTAVNKLRGTEVEAKRPRKKAKKERRGFFHDNWLDDEDEPKRKSKKSSVEPELPELARSYRILDINGERLETGNVEKAPGQDFTDILRYFVEKYPDFRQEVRTIVNGDGVDLDDRLFMRVYLSISEDPNELEGLDCVMDESKADETTVLVTTKSGDAEILFPEGFRPWSAVKGDDGQPTVIATAEENEKFSKLYAKTVAERKAKKAEELKAQQQDQPKPADPSAPQADPQKADDPKPADSSK